MCGRYSLAPDQSKEIAQIVAEVQARIGAASIYIGETFLTNAAPILLPGKQKMTPKPMVWGFPSFKGRGASSMLILVCVWQEAPCTSLIKALLHKSQSHK